MNFLKLDLIKFWQDWNVVIAFSLIKLFIHFLTNTNYDLHRDEYLYLVLGEHLNWGYMEVPPFIAILGKLAISLGGSLFITRLFPALIGCITLILIGVMVRDLDGKKWAQTFACLAFLISPAFLRSNTLFQPVSFNQFFWFLSAFFIVRLIRYKRPRTWYYIGLVAGLGFLTKYSIVFFFVSFLFAILLTPHRRWLKTKYPYLATGIAFLISLPNLIWQFQHNFPIAQHMTELIQTQLVNVQTFGFLKAQLITHQMALIIWMTGFLYLLLSKQLSNYRILAWIYLGVIFLLLLFSGKSYYSLGVYPMLMAVGGVAIEKLLGKRSHRLKYGLILLIIFLTIPILPYGLPILSINAMQQYSAIMKEKFSLDGPLYWEDGRLHSLPQDYADMNGWEELAVKVSKLYHSLPVADRNSCLVFGGSYSHASSLNYYREKYDLPEVYSFVGSHLIWTPDSLTFDRQIMADDVFHTTSHYFNYIQLVDSIQNPYAREPGYIYYLTSPKIDLNDEWRKLVYERKKRFNF